MEFINGNCTLTAEEHKELVKFLFEQDKQAVTFERKMQDAGFSTHIGLAASVISTAWKAVYHITASNIADEDAFFFDFCEGTDFEAFYQKYYKGEF